ncbi:MAG TPA: hypothetical protein PLR88_03855 [Bacteroidales bacterium]|nr:hypothetical protein [Bacteroidales bacterium]
MEAFSKGDYGQAYSEFSELLLKYSRDPLYRYYSGVCLVKLKKDPGKAVTLLNEAIKGASAVKSLPSDAFFYLGQAQQMTGMFEDAVKSYNQYTSEVGKKSAREFGVPGLIQECNAKKGKLEESETDAGEVSENKNDEAEKVSAEKVSTAPVVVEKPVPVKTVLPNDYDAILDVALKYQFKADSVNKQIEKQKGELDKLSNNEKAALKGKISENEMLAASFQKSADQKFNEAQAAMNPQLNGNRSKEMTQSEDKKITADSSKAKEIITSKDTLKKTNNGGAVNPAPATVNKPVNRSQNQSDTIISSSEDTSSKPVPVFSYFDVLATPVADSDTKVPIDADVPEGLIYRIQIAVFRNPVTPAFFKGITPVYGFKVPETDKYVYYAGMFRRSSDAHRALTEVKLKGFKDAFVIALSDKKSISADRAAALEKEWGSKPFAMAEQKATTKKTAAATDKKIPDTTKKEVSETAANEADTLLPTLSFRVEVVRSPKPLKKDAIEEIKKVAGNRGFDIQVLDGGNIAYLIGNFITFDSAAEYADLLVRNGFSKAQVVARLGKKEIPVETARQLFDNLK